MSPRFRGLTSKPAGCYIGVSTGPLEAYVPGVSLDSAASRINPLVAAVLRSPVHWFLSSGLMLITVTGRRTGRRYTIPVGYQRHGDVLTILVSDAPKKQWWRNFRDPAPVEVRLKGKPLSGTAHLLSPASAEFKTQAEETLRRLPWMARVFGVEYTKGQALSDAQLATLARKIAVVQVRLPAA
jgi:deazaflavin-dependent oxidoreductase (nitroreductase family)